MSRGYNARRKAKRQQGRASAEPKLRARRTWPRRLVALVPVLIIAAILALVGILGFGADNGVSKRQVEQEVAELLDGIPQKGAVLGSPKAPITVWVYGDLECPTVKLFVENHLSSIIETWVRTGDARLHYRSLETDTLEEKVFFKQEIAALAAGRQGSMWNFLLTFVRQQGEVRTDYVTEEFLTDIASHIPGLGLEKWYRDRDDALLSKQVALGVYSGRTNELRSTPSFLIGFTKGEVDRSVNRASIKKELKASLGRISGSLSQEARGDFPTVRIIDPNLIGG